MDQKQELIQYIEARIVKAFQVSKTWPDPRSVLRPKCSNPEVLKSVEDWLSYNSESARDKLRRRRTDYTPKEHAEAQEAIEWVRYASKRYVGRHKSVITGIITLRLQNMRGFRVVAQELREFNMRYSHTTIKRRYDLAMEDIYYHIKRNF